MLTRLPRKLLLLALLLAAPVSVRAEGLPTASTVLDILVAPVCSAPVAAGSARCHVLVRTDARAKAARPAPASATKQAGVLGNGGAYDPSYLQSAYSLPSNTRG